jgi:hypothetical protein
MHSVDDGNLTRKNKSLVNKQKTAMRCYEDKKPGESPTGDSPIPPLAPASITGNYNRKERGK